MRQWVYTLADEWGPSDTNSDYPYLSSMDAALQREEAAYFDQFELMGPVAALNIRTGSAASDANSAIDSIMPKAVLVRVKPARNRQKYKKQAEKLQYFGAATLDVWRQKKDVVYQLAADQTIRRLAIARVMFDTRLWPTPDEAQPPEIIRSSVKVAGDDGTEEEVTWDIENEDYIDWLVKYRRKYPIILERRDPRFCRWREYDGDIAALVESYSTTAFEAKLTWSNYQEVHDITHGMMPNQTLQVHDIWVGQYRCILLNDQPIYPIHTDGESRVHQGVGKHGYPCIPYIVAPFRELPFDTPVKRYRGMLSDSVALYQAEAQVLSMIMSMLAINSWRTYAVWTKDGRQIKIIPGMTVPIDKRVGEYVELMSGDPVPDQLLVFPDTIDHYIQRNGVAQGPRTAEGTRSAQQLWAVQAMRQMKIEAPIDNLQRLLSRALSLAAMILETMVKEPVTLPVPGKDHEGADLGEVTVKPSDINGYYDGFRVVFNRRLDPALLEQAKTLQVFQANRWMPKRVSWEMSGLTDSPQEWDDELAMDQIDDLPFMKELLGLKKLEADFGRDSDEYQLLYQQILQSKQAPQGPDAGGAKLTPSSPRGQTPGAGAPSGPGASMAQGGQARRQRPAGNMSRGRTGPSGPPQSGGGV